MTTTIRGGDRTGADSYPTPPWCVHALLNTLALPAGRWLEPSAGHGAILHAVQTMRSDVTWTAVEIDPACEASLRAQTADVHIADFLQYQPPQPFDVVIANPPYSRAQEFVVRALQQADTVAMLLRLSFVSSKGRFDLMSRTAPDVYVLPDRPQFAGTNRDSSDYAWFVWRTGVVRRSGQLCVLDPTPAAQRTPFRQL